MQKYSLNNFQVELDMDATEKWYATSEGWRCECRYCRNFLRLAKTKELPLHIMQILDELDITMIRRGMIFPARLALTMKKM